MSYLLKRCTRKNNHLIRKVILANLIFNFSWVFAFADEGKALIAKGELIARTSSGKTIAIPAEYQDIAENILRQRPDSATLQVQEFKKYKNPKLRFETTNGKLINEISLEREEVITGSNEKRVISKWATVSQDGSLAVINQSQSPRPIKITPSKKSLEFWEEKGEIIVFDNTGKEIWRRILEGTWFFSNISMSPNGKKIAVNVTPSPHVDKLSDEILAPLTVFDRNGNIVLSYPPPHSDQYGDTDGNNPIFSPNGTYIGIRVRVEGGYSPAVIDLLTKKVWIGEKWAQLDNITDEGLITYSEHRKTELKTLKIDTTTSKLP